MSLRRLGLCGHIANTDRLRIRSHARQLALKFRLVRIDAPPSPLPPSKSPRERAPICLRGARFVFLVGASSLRSHLSCFLCLRWSTLVVASQHLSMSHLRVRLHRREPAGGLRAFSAKYTWDNTQARA